MTAAVTTMVSSTDSDVARMRDSMRTRRGPRVRIPPASARLRDSATAQLAARWGVTERSAEDRLSGDRSVFRQAGDAILILSGLGAYERIATLMVPIDAAMIRETVPLAQALHEAEVADSLEQIADEAFRHKLHEGTATETDAREYLRRSAIARAKAEVAEQAVLRWIDEQKRTRGDV